MNLDVSCYRHGNDLMVREVGLSGQTIALQVYSCEQCKLEAIADYLGKQKKECSNVDAQQHKG